MLHYIYSRIDYYGAFGYCRQRGNPPEHPSSSEYASSRCLIGGIAGIEISYGFSSAASLLHITVPYYSGIVALADKRRIYSYRKCPAFGFYPFAVGLYGENLIPVFNLDRV